MKMTQKSRRGLVAAVAVAALVPSGVIASAEAFKASAAATKSVSLKNKKFSPSKVTISKGSTVKWTWREKVPHNIIAKGNRFKSLTKLKSSGTYSVKFSKKGTFSYSCTIHPGMVGKVVVK